jgi:hypothetical protein
VSHPLDVIKVRLDRAYHQFDTLALELDAFVKGKPNTLVPEEHADSLGWTIRYRQLKPIPPLWSVQIGEIVHDLHSALDHIVWQVVIKETGAETQSTKLQFPVFLTKGGYEKPRSRGGVGAGEEKLPGVSGEVRALIKELQPFSTGENADSPLWHLYCLSVWDKHKDAVISCFLPKRLGLRRLSQREVERVAIAPPGPLKDGAEILDVRLKPGTVRPRPKDMEMYAEAAALIAFEKPESVWAREVLPTVARCGDRVNEILERFRAEIFG